MRAAGVGQARWYQLLSSMHSGGFKEKHIRGLCAYIDPVLDRVCKDKNKEIRANIKRLFSSDTPKNRDLRQFKSYNEFLATTSNAVPLLAQHRSDFNMSLRLNQIEWKRLSRKQADGPDSVERSNSVEKSPGGFGPGTSAVEVDHKKFRGKVENVDLDACVSILFRSSLGDYEKVREVFISGRLAEFDVMRLQLLEKPTRILLEFDDTEFRVTLASIEERLSKVIEIAGLPQDVRDNVRTTLLSKFRRASLTRPWRRLRCLFSTNPFIGSASHGIADSGARAYSCREPHGKTWPVTSADLRANFLWWPLATAFALVAVIASLWLGGIWQGNYISAIVGVGSGIAMSMAGGLVCSSVSGIGPLAVGAGAIPLALAFGLAHSFLFSISPIPLSLDPSYPSMHPFTAVVGGPIGLSAADPSIMAMPKVAKIALVAIVGLAISLSGWLMAQPARARGDSTEPFSVDLKNGIVGAIVGGSGIPITLILTRLAGEVVPLPLAFAGSFATVGSVFFCFSIWRQLVIGAPVGQNLERKAAAKAVSLGFALIYIFVITIILTLVFGSYSSVVHYLALSMASAVFHSTFFTAAFVVAASSRRGSARAATIATAIEGAGGFVIFAILQGSLGQLLPL